MKPIDIVFFFQADESVLLWKEKLCQSASAPLMPDGHVVPDCYVSTNRKSECGVSETKHDEDKRSVLSYVSNHLTTHLSSFSDLR